MQDSWPIFVGIAIAAAIAGLGIGWLSFRAASARRIAASRRAAEEILAEASREAELARKAALLEAREQGLREKERFEEETRSIRRDLETRGNAVADQEGRLQREGSRQAEEREEIERDRRSLAQEKRRLLDRKKEVEAIVAEQTQRLEKIAGLTVSEARLELKKNLEDEVRGDVARLGQRLREEAIRSADREARRLIVIAIQRLAAEQSIESTVTVVPLPNDEMKGRIIGREGRNIRAFETATGVDVIIDDTPEAVLLSAYDPVRRETARIALERLIVDGRIHPGRIEEIVAKVAEEVAREIEETGERAGLEVGVHGLAPEVQRGLGRLRYRTSSGQNVLRHSMEVAWLADLMGSELGLDRDLARKGGLLHDIGKGLDHEHEGPHALIGMEFLRRMGESELVCEVVGAHHQDHESDSVYAALVSAADAISGARPGARRETLETYVKRLKKLEELADSFEGVDRSFAIQAGREIRILVQHQAVDDGDATGLANEIARRIEKELQYPGQIKVVVIREMRVVDYAR
ncbi:MAG: ribonuclease Y [Candidatus Eisenbacteria bacterium]|nr:ribonuclease Y [Candidatus Latescibacterota bacterium]MBD3302980.1 ribonuclease Y [Candidatus Eisenbacteria bacterium]